MRAFLSEEGFVDHFSKAEIVVATRQNVTVRGIQELTVKHMYIVPKGQYCIYMYVRVCVCVFVALYGFICFHFTSPQQSLI